MSLFRKLVAALAVAVPALLSLSVAARAGGRIRVLAPASSALTDGDSYDVELSVPAGLTEVRIIRTSPARRDPSRLLPVQGARLDARVALSPGKNLFQVFGIDADGRQVKGPSFKIFRAADGPAARPRR